jgi:ABC-type amino acid transport substrate-binding protein
MNGALPHSEPKQVVNSALAQLYRSGVAFKVYDKWFRHLGKPPASLLAMYGINALPE